MMVGWKSVLLLAFLAACHAARTVSYDGRSFFIDGERKLILSGGMHYNRVPRSDWDGVMKMAKAMGLNTIQGYFMWNFHEHSRGNITWEGQADLSAFMELAKANDLMVTLRIGPYVCGEYYAGGLPLWLRHVDNISCYRCSDPIWKREVQRIVSIVVAEMEKYLWPNGGPIIMLQIENEYNGGDQDYLDWAVEMARSLTTDVPWNLCHDVQMCIKSNAKAEALCTINGFWMEQRDGFVSQPSLAWIDTLKDGLPNQPLVWTEDQGWFDEWGVAQRVRDPRDQAYGIARWLAYGGAYHNFYMMTGGNNYARNAGGTVTTAYAPDTVIDYLFLPHQPRYDFYTDLFDIVKSISGQLLNNSIATAVPLATSPSLAEAAVTMAPCQAQASRWTFQTLSQSAMLIMSSFNGMCLQDSEDNKPLLTACNESDITQHWTYNTTTQHIQSYVSKPCRAKGSTGNCLQCLDLEGGQGTSLDIWDCKLSQNGQQANQQFKLQTDRIQHVSGSCLAVTNLTGAEAHVYGSVVFLSNYDSVTSVSVEYNGQTFFLANHSLLIYDTKAKRVLFNTSAITTTTEKLGRDQTRVSSEDWEYFTEPVGHGARSTSTADPEEQLLITDNDSDYLWYTVQGSFTQGAKINYTSVQGSITYPYVNGQRLTTILSDADSSYGEGSQHVTFQVADDTDRIDILSVAMGVLNTGVSPKQGKGIAGPVTVDGQDITSAGWTMSWWLYGEQYGAFDPARSAQCPWKPVQTQSPDDNATMVWFKTTLDAPQPEDDSDSPFAYALDLSSLNKGVAYVNGFDIGRYWLKNGECDGECAPPHHGDYCFERYKDCNTPTQTLYHVPTEVVKETRNLIVVLEESEDVQARDLTKVALVRLTQHPVHD
eukprot:TRINITY_DN12498_c0_g2_i8.p1 TRINITY_DN12498_c0_g2~~TRINITY_DN12498_c0_g2_i8.p1  ORF type:complete len:877 (+),score=175.89 TRINITY_DN12498_c0_g2_i8:2-2632(+)